MSSETSNELLTDIKIDTMKACNVVIIGAGVAGLSAANALLDYNNDDFIILEARKECGGRVAALSLENEKVELGANWIHGVLGNPIYELASVNGLVNITQEVPVDNVVAILPNGENIPNSILEEIYDAYDRFFKKCEAYYLNKYIPHDYVESVGEHLKTKIGLYLEKFSDRDKDIRQRIFSYLLNRETCISGCNSMDEIDLREIGSYTELPGGNIIPLGGYSSILSPLMKHIPTGKILTDHTVEKIIWKNDKSVENINKCKPIVISNKKVTVKCSNKEKFVADHVICTIPLGVLKDNVHNLFQPGLPESKLESINKLCFGVVNKIFLQYEKPFLDPGLSEVVFLWEEIDKKESLNERWFKKIYSFRKVTETLLLGWISGEEAKYMESLTFDVVARTCTLLLRQYLNDPIIPCPKMCICTNWWSHPYTRGSYTSIPCGSTGKDLLNVGISLKDDPSSEKPTLLFAGEHCHRHFYSTVHGAFLSGKDAVECLCISKSNENFPVEADLSSSVEGM